MMCYRPTSYIMFSLKKLKFYGDRGPGAGGRRLDMKAVGRIAQTPWGPDSQRCFSNELYLYGLIIDLSTI